MPANRGLTMRQMRQMLRLLHDGVSAREVGDGWALHAAPSKTISNGRRRQASPGRFRPILTDDILEQRLFSKAGYIPGVRQRAEPDWATLAREIKRPGVNPIL